MLNKADIVKLTGQHQYLPRRAVGGSWLGAAAHYFVPKCCDQEPGLCSGLPPTRGGADLWEMGRGEAQFCYLFHSFRCIPTFPVRSKVRQRYESKDGRGWGRKRRDLESYSLIPILILIADLEKMFGRVSEGWKNFRGSRGPNKYFFTSLPMSYFSNQTYLLYTVTDQAIVDMKETCQM